LQRKRFVFERSERHRLPIEHDVRTCPRVDASRDAEALHPEWVHQAGDELVLHPKMPPLRVITATPGRSLVAFAAADETARAEGRPWAAARWAFLVEPLGPERCRVLSRFRSACSENLVTRLAQGPALLEPIGFAMDRRMLLGIRERALAGPGH